MLGVALRERQVVPDCLLEGGGGGGGVFIRNGGKAMLAPRVVLAGTGTLISPTTIQRS